MDNAVVAAMTLAEVLVLWRPPSDAHVQALIQLSAKFVIDLNNPLGCGELVLFLSEPFHCHSIQFIAHVKQWFLIVDLRILSDRRTNDKAGHRQVPVFLVRFCF